MLAKKKFLPKMKNVHLDKCADCMAGKHNRAAFRSRPLMRRKTVSELIHTDVCYVDMKSHSVDNTSRPSLTITVVSCGLRY